MSASMVTHKLMRTATREHTHVVMHRAGITEPVIRTTYERTCLCGQVFVGSTELQSIGLYLAHLPKPKPITERGASEQPAAL